MLYFILYKFKLFIQFLYIPLVTSRLPQDTFAKEYCSVNDELSKVAKQDEVKEEMNFLPSLQRLPVCLNYELIHCRIYHRKTI
jgi:hypothetical protein